MDRKPCKAMESLSITVSTRDVKLFIGFCLSCNEWHVSGIVGNGNEVHASSKSVGSLIVSALGIAGVDPQWIDLSPADSLNLFVNAQPMSAERN